jgi:predicted amidophosphoribosyltransferase
MKFIHRIYRRLFPPTPTGPCYYCGKDTSEISPFCPNTGFRHLHCYEKELQRKREERDEREKIDLIKKAIRELENEKRTQEEPE